MARDDKAYRGNWQSNYLKFHKRFFVDFGLVFLMKNPVRHITGFELMWENITQI